MNNERKKYISELTDAELEQNINRYLKESSRLASNKHMKTIKRSINNALQDLLSEHQSRMLLGSDG